MPARPTPRTPRKQSRGSVTRKKILRAAERGFSRTGYGATPLADAAESDPELRERRLRLDQLAIEQLTHMITLGEESGRFRKDEPAQTEEAATNGEGSP